MLFRRVWKQGLIPSALRVGGRLPLRQSETDAERATRWRHVTRGSQEYSFILLCVKTFIVVAFSRNSRRPNNDNYLATFAGAFSTNNCRNFDCFCSCAISSLFAVLDSRVVSPLACPR